MQHVTGERLIALAATVATVLAALSGIAAAVVLTQWDPPRALLAAGAVLAGIAALVTGVAAWRAADRALLAVAVSVLAFALSSAVSGIAITVLVVVAQGALVAAGVIVARAARGTRRALGWTVVVAAVGWFVTLLALSTIPLVALSQVALDVAVALPYVLQTVAYLAAALLVAVPLFRPVRAGAAHLWDTAQVR
ncbi:hypothetical protein [Curtobacterium sp. MCBA15_008]|uniref:hypothetical protein n=1 Tax=Curtobacterium sp. MCBA15_008 TaxID=1898736 RepID=UPI0008DE94C1|nr:hypothetical protein [Curtobacterium sp. MCBA15_008]OII05304.1 hypothetical protein BIU96_06505 [Curtobacterium sp. MCBA15_008]